jgi:signal transduction histidine kinase/CheY-like chemotaxis protein
MVARLGSTARAERPEVDLRDLRTETLRVLTLTILLLLVAILWLALVDSQTRRLEIWLVLLPLLAAAGARRIGRFGQTLAAIWLIAGLSLSLIAAEIVYPASQFIFAFPLLVLIASTLLGELPSFIVAAAASLAVLIMAPYLDTIVPARASGSVLFLVWATAVLSWVALRPTRTALDWAWTSYSLALQRTEESRDRQGELGRLAKSLGEACARLEQMNWELERARRAAEDARRLKSEFAAAISHELRTPLNLIIGFTEMMLDAPRAYAGASLPKEYRQDLEAIHHNADHISRLINDVLDLSQVEAHRMALERTEAAPCQIVGEAAGTVASLFEHLGLHLTIEIPADLPPVYVDANRVRQILINLLNNAARFTEYGGVTLGAQCDGHDMILTVADTGVGIAPEDLPFVFEEFRQVGPVGRRRRGNGLGLAVCKQFAEMHGGYIRVESQLGHGSTFYLSLPLRGNVVTTPLTITPSPRPTEDQTIAVLDREPETARVFQRYLDGYHVAWVGSLAGLCELAANRLVHAVVFADAEAASNWRETLVADPRFRNLPVFTCSLNTRRTLARELGVTQYVTKPISRAELSSILNGLGKRTRDVLIVEDEPEMARLLAGMIRITSRRYRIRQACDGTEALMLLREKRPDVVLLDLLLPSVDGYSVLCEMRNDSLLREIPVVVISAKGTGEEAMRTSSLGINRADGLTVGEVMRCLRGSLDALLELSAQSSVPRQTAGPAA